MTGKAVQAAHLTPVGPSPAVTERGQCGPFPATTSTDRCGARGLFPPMMIMFVPARLAITTLVLYLAVTNGPLPLLLAGAGMLLARPFVLWWTS